MPYAYVNVRIIVLLTLKLNFKPYKNQKITINFGLGLTVTNVN